MHCQNRFYVMSALRWRLVIKGIVSGDFRPSIFFIHQYALVLWFMGFSVCFKSIYSYSRRYSTLRYAAYSTEFRRRAMGHLHSAEILKMFNLRLRAMLLVWNPSQTFFWLHAMRLSGGVDSASCRIARSCESRVFAHIYAKTKPNSKIF
jgi:hypothetical protein